MDFDPTTALIGENSAGKSTVLDALAICLSGHDDRVLLEARDFHRGDAALPSSDLRIALTYQEEEEGEWAPSRWARFVPFATPGAQGLRRLTVQVTGTHKPNGDLTEARWTFSPDTGSNTGVVPGLLAEWRHLNPLVRLRANRHVELSPRGDVEEPPSALQGGRADPATWRLEQQIRRVYDRLTGASDVLPDELRQGLAAAEELLAAPRLRVRTPGAGRPRGESDLAETPRRVSRRPELLVPSIKQGTGLRGLALVALIGAVLEARERRTLTDDSQPLIVLEDAEAHLHPVALSAMWELISALRAQKIVTTNSGELLAAVPLGSIRRLVTDRAGTRVYSIDPDRYTADDIRRIAYHVRINRAGALFARCWLLVEGETEAWLLPELGQMCGYDFPAEGIRCVEFAQCGVRPLVKLANDLGIEWHLLADGDEAGQSYSGTAAAFLQGRPVDERITRLEEHDIEHCMFSHGYEFVFRDLAGPAPRDARGRRSRERATHIITRAIKARSKPGVALALLEAANAPGGGMVPPPLRATLETVARLARGEMRPVTLDVSCQ